MLNYIRRKVKLNILQYYWNSKGHFKYYGEEVFFPKNSVIYKRAIKEGIYELDNLNFIFPWLKKKSVVFDIGANIGLMALPILNNDASIKVYSIEASPNTFPYLERTHQAHSCNNRWKIVNNAVSDKAGIIDFQIGLPEDGAYESIKDTKRTNFKSSIKVNCITIDQLWHEEHEPDVSFIKVDIEGADLLALRGGANCLDSCKPAILMEWNQTNIEPFGLNNQDLLSFTKEAKYTIYALPYLNKVETKTDLNLFGKQTENFLLLPNE